MIHEWAIIYYKWPGGEITEWLVKQYNDESGDALGAQLLSGTKDNKYRDYTEYNELDHSFNFHRDIVSEIIPIHSFGRFER